METDIMATYTNNDVTVSNPNHHFRANNMSKAARLAVKEAGLATPYTYEVLSHVSPALNDSTPVIRAYSKSGRKSVTITAEDIFFALENDR
jgi:hypothetical protein